jgi:hypothetical protein
MHQNLLLYILLKENQEHYLLITEVEQQIFQILMYLDKIVLILLI